MTKQCKRLIEVDLPIKRISAHARREKSIRHGHISTLHIWWARRPLAACRAVICASLWPDPADVECPLAFREAALQQMLAFSRATQSNKDLAAICDAESWKRYKLLGEGNAINLNKTKDLERLRSYLFDFIADVASWEASTNQIFLDTARSLTQSAHEALGGEKGTRPLVVDPFAGGGAIPLESLRIGADAFASDLNPVAVLLNKVVLEYIPKFGAKLADEVRKWGQWVKEQAETELAHFYPKDSDGSTPIAYLWARTIQCEGPGCGAEVPLMRSLWLAKKGARSIALKIVPNPDQRRVDFEILKDAKAKDVGEGTVRRGSATCPCCGYTTPVASVRSQLAARKGGAHDARLFVVVTTRTSEQGRFYRLPTAADHKAIRAAAAELEARKAAWTHQLALIPDEPLPPQGTLGFRVQLYGMLRWGDLFTPRQLLSLTTLGRHIREAGERLSKEHSREFANAVQALLSMQVSKLAPLSSSLSPWSIQAQCPLQIFSRHALPMLWDFAEGMPLGESSGSFGVITDGMAHAMNVLGHSWNEGQAHRVDAANHSLPEDAATTLFTDPPYYDAIPYADLADFFHVWLRRLLNHTHPSLFSEELTPKDQECVVDRVRGHDNAFFERTMTKALTDARRYVVPSGIGVVVFAHKSTAGWEAQLGSMIEAGWVVTASWPLDTEYGSRIRAQDSAALASSVHLVCRPREHPDGTLRQDEVGDWRDVLAELPKRIREWMARLSSEGVVGADAIFACLGPALEIFSRYSRVEKASGETVLLKEYLTYVWGAVAQEALTQIFQGADATGFEEDARLTAMWLWTLNAGGVVQAVVTEALPDAEDTDAADESEDEDDGGGKSKGSGYVLEFDAARKIAQGLGAHLEQMSDVVEVKGDKARLLGVGERARKLFGKDEAEAPKAKGKKKPKQMSLGFMQEIEAAETDGDWGDKSVPKLGDTILDRIHQSMILFAAGRGEALRRFLVEDGAGQDQRFWKLANALSALYPQGTDEKRWVDGVLARKKGLGL